MKNDCFYYSVGALLYCPANKKGIADSVISEKFGTSYSLALCLEDTVGDDFVEEAEDMLARSVRQIYASLQETSFYLPKLFVRVRNPFQIMKLTRSFVDSM